MKSTTQWTKRLFSILLCICMMLSVAPTVPLAVSAAEYPTITVGVAVTFELNETATAGIYAFTPEESGVYRFYTYNSARDTYGYLLDADGNVLAEDDDGANSGNNFLIAYEMTAGTTYLLKARFYAEGAEGSMTMLLEKAATPTAITINQGDSFVGYPIGIEWFTHTLEPAGSATLGVTWASDDPDIVKIDTDGNARFMAPGTTAVTVTTAEGLTATCEVTVLDPLPLKAGETVTATCDLNYHVTYSFIPEKTATYAFFTESEQYIPYTELRYTNDMDLMVVTYDENQQDYEFRLQHELTEGTEYYLYIFGHLLDATFDVTAQEVVPATAMTLDHTTLDVNRGGSARLRPVYTPQNAIYEALTWESSDDTVVSVDENGTVRFLKEGTVTVTATSENGFTASCEITVGGYPILSLCKAERADIAVGGNAATYLFTPEKSGNYAFYAESDYDTFGYIYDATGETLLYTGDDYGNDRDFRVEATLEAGMTYQLQGAFYYDTQVGPMNLTVVHLDDNGDIIHDIPEYVITDDSHSGVCDGCGTSVTGAHIHDENGLCVCGHLHIHTGTDYTYDATGHRYACDCGEVVQEAHTPDESGNCVCGWFAHDHEVTDYSYDDDAHRGICDLCDKDIEESHTLDESNTCVCGYFEHQHEGDFIYDTDYHYGNCTVCHQYINEEHTCDENGNCSCGWFVHLHGGDAYDYAESGHWLACSQCGVGVGSWEEHTYDEYDECICGDTIVYGVYFGNTFIGSYEYLDSNGNVTAEMPTGGYAYYEDGVLTLHDFTYMGWGTVQEDATSLVYADAALEIVLEGNNSLRSPEGDGIFVSGADLTISGDGSLAIKADGNYDGIDVDGGTLRIESGTLNIDATDHGIEVYGDLKVYGGVITIVAGDDGFDITEGDAKFNGGVIDIHAEDNGIDCSDNITINGGIFTIRTNDDNGIEALGDITIDGGDFDIDANDECLCAVDGTITVNGGEFALEAGPTDAVMMAGTDIVIAETVGTFETATDDYGDVVLVDENGETAQSITVTSSDTAFIQADWITLSQTTGVYTGKILTPPTVTVVNDNGETLVKDTDYTLSWSTGTIKYSGIYIVTVTGIGAYSGTKLKTYTVYEDVVYVGDGMLVNGDYLYNNGKLADEAPAEGGYAHYADGVLTLNNFTYEGGGYVYNTVDAACTVIFALNDLTIELVGDNTIITGCDGIAVCADLIIGGEGSLTIEGEFGIGNYGGDITVNGGTFNITAATDAVWAYGDVNIIDGNLTAAAGSSNIYAEDAVNISGGELVLMDAEADGENYYSGYGIYADSGDITISGGTIVIDTQTGIYNYDYSIFISGGTVDITGEYGIWADYYDVTVNGGTVSIEADYGIYAYYGIYIEGGFVDITSTQYAMCADTEILIYNHVTVKAPENGTVEAREDGCFVVDDAGEIALNVILETHIAGDVNVDGALNTSDVRIVLQSITGLVELTQGQQQKADVNEDGKINSADIRHMLQTITSQNG